MRAKYFDDADIQLLSSMIDALAHYIGWFIIMWWAVSNIS